MYPPQQPKRHWTDSPTKILGLVAALLSVITGVVTLLIQLGAFGSFRIPFLPKSRPETAISLSLGEGSSGTAVTVTGRGFDSGETVTIRFHTDQVGTARADGAFSQQVRVPGTFDALPGQQFTIIATGESSSRSARAPFLLRTSGGGGGSGGTGTARISLSRGSGPSGTRVTVTGENFRPGEEVTVRFHTDQVGSAIVDAKGSFSVAIRIPGSYDVFGTNQYEIVATGGTSVKSASRPFKLTV